MLYDIVQVIHMKIYTVLCYIFERRKNSMLRCKAIIG